MGGREITDEEGGRPADPELLGHLAALRALRRDAHALIAGLRTDQLVWRTSGGRSILDWLEEASAVGRAHLESIEALIEGGRRRGWLLEGGRHRHPPLTALVLWLVRSRLPLPLPPPPRHRLGVPASDTTVAVFQSVHEQLAAGAIAADGLDLARPRARHALLLRPSLGQWFALTAAYGRHYLDQARRVRGRRGFPA